jgi:hypothetical protein
VDKRESPRSAARLRADLVGHPRVAGASERSVPQGASRRADAGGGASSGCAPMSWHTSLSLPNATASVTQPQAVGDPACHALSRCCSLRVRGGESEPEHTPDRGGPSDNKDVATGRAVAPTRG